MGAATFDLYVEESPGKRYLLERFYTKRKGEGTFFAHHSVPTTSWIKAILIPTRTHEWGCFAKDLFLPLFINYALKINNVILKFFASLPSLIVDVITIPIRLISSPYQLWKRYKQPISHPLFNYINELENSDELIPDDPYRKIRKGDHVKLVLVTIKGCSMTEQTRDVYFRTITG